AAQPVSLEIAVPGMGIEARDVAELVEVCRKAIELRVDHRIGPIGRDDAAFPARGLDRLVMVERIERALGRGDDLDLELLEQRTRAEFGLRQTLGDAVEIVVRGRG